VSAEHVLQGQRLSAEVHYEQVYEPAAVNVVLPAGLLAQNWKVWMDVLQEHFPV
jgi:hypothetical protein